MKNEQNNRGPSFEELRRRRSRQADADHSIGRELFDTDWDVFVAKYDHRTGQYVTSTYCCEDAVSV